MDTRNGLQNLKKRKIYFPCRESKQNSSFLQPVSNLISYSDSISLYRLAQTYGRFGGGGGGEIAASNFRKFHLSWKLFLRYGGWPPASRKLWYSLQCTRRHIPQDLKYSSARLRERQIQGFLDVTRLGDTASHLGRLEYSEVPLR
jgi:hypothetical protein